MSEGRPSITVAVDVVLFAVQHAELYTLLIERGRPPFQGMWAFPGGMVEVDEPLVQAARRELAEETGIQEVPFLAQLAAFGDPGRDPRGRVVSIAYWGLVPRMVTPRGADDAAKARWWPLSALPALAFDHEHILQCACHRLQAAVQHDLRLLFHLVPAPFVLRELQNAYEAILGHATDKRNFRRHILQQGWLEEVGIRTHDGPGRPAREFRPLPHVIPLSPEDRCA